MDEVWWSRISQPTMHNWSEQGEPLRLQDLPKQKNDPDPKALACYGMLSASSGRMRLRFVEGRPVSQVTTDFLEWLYEQVQAQGQRVLVLIWDNASWHVSQQVKSPWLNRIEPKWVHGKRAIVEPTRLLTARELRQRVCDYFGCEQTELLIQPVASSEKKEKRVS